VLNTWAQGRAGKVTLVTDKRNANRVFMETAKKRDRLEDLGVDG